MNSKKKGMTLATQTESSRMDLPGTGFYYDRNHEFLSNDPCIYHFLQTGAGANMRLQIRSSATTNVSLQIKYSSSPLQIHSCI